MFQTCGESMNKKGEGGKAACPSAQQYRPTASVGEDLTVPHPLC